MPPPKRRDDYKGAKARGSVSDDSWRSEIENLSLNDDRWTCVIAMIVETRVEHTGYLEMFDEAAEEETREAIFSLSYAKLIRETKLVAKSDLHQGICHFASKKIEDEAEEGLGPWLICRLVKFFVNRAKTRSLEILRSRARIEKEITREIETLGSHAGPNTIAKSKGGSEDAKPFDKVNTKLRKRGEKWRDRIRIDDAPVDGPNLYVVLSGFRDVKLAAELLDAGLPLTGIFKVLRPREEPDADHPQLSNFWSNLEATLNDPKAAARYSKVAFQTFCPPEIEQGGSEGLKTDAYRRISFLAYDLCDLKRQHGTYIRKMRLQTGLEENRERIQATGRYDTIMSFFPEECVSVSMILDALLSQIDGSERPGETLSEEKKSSEKFEERFRSKIDRLNTEFDVFDVGKAEIQPGNSDLRLILHGDYLARKTHGCFSESRGSTIAPDFGVRVLREFGETLIWKNCPPLTGEKMKMHGYHIGEVSDCFDGDTDSSTTGHYLHLLLFDKLINGESPRRNLLEGEDLERKISFPRLEELRPKSNVRRTKSQIIASGKSLAESLPTSCQSDGAIEYRKEISDTFECPELFSLTDTRGMLRSGYTATPEVIPVRNPGILDLEEFDTVQLLSADVFPQIFFTCYREFDTFETRYFPPTDSMLLYFHNERISCDDIFEREYVASIRTPVCLRDFVGFVIDEEKEWIEKEEEKHGGRFSEKAEALRNSQTPKAGSDIPLAGLYTDSDFILENSIKGAEVRKEKARQGLIDGTETGEELPAEAKGRPKEAKKANPGKGKNPKRKGKAINPSHEREESLKTDGSFPPLGNTASVRSFEDADPAFLGYDIANRRVQVSGFGSEFTSDDGTAVRVNREEWFRGEPRLQIMIELLGNELVVHSVAGDEHVAFHFATGNGILMGFSLPLRRKARASPGSGQSITKRNYQGGKMGRESGTPRGAWTPEMAVDPGFRASWPSGLVVETLPGDGPSEPFYIKQSYLSKGPECTGISGETGRVFLRDGTVLVFLEDHGVRIMRSNGCTVNCSGFEKDDKQRRKEEEGDSFPESGPKTTRNGAKAKRKSRNSFAEDNGTLGLGNSAESLKRFKIHRSVVLEPDGRRYEILDGERTRELGQELVRTASDYEVGEKFTRRSDGTDILINTDGFLGVCFPDGSRITTGYVIEDDPVSCGWTEEEIRRFYPAENARLKSRENILEEDGFVSVFLTSCMEHKNYARVAYDQSKIDCTLSMPGDVGVQISSDNLFSVTVGAETSLKVGRDEVEFAGRTGKSVFNLEDSSSSSATETSTFLETKDSSGNVFRVDFDGKTSHEKSRDSFKPAENNEDPDPSSSRLRTPGTNQSQPNSKSYRLFAVKRDLSAYEHLRRYDGQTQEDDRTSSIFFHEVHQQSGRRLRTTLTALNPITESQAWLQPHRAKSIRPTNEDRRDLLRSTYSVPWNYLIPYGRNGPGIRDRTWNLPLKDRGDFSWPEVVLARTRETIKNREVNVLKKLQEALGCYWSKSMNKFDEYRDFVSPKCSGPKECEMENWVKDFALGRKKTFDRALYFDGLCKSRGTRKAESRICKRKNSGSGDKSDEEEIEWYKTCLRDHTVPPYFADVSGSCFTWVLECVNKIGETREGAK